MEKILTNFRVLFSAFLLTINLLSKCNGYSENLFGRSSMRNSFLCPGETVEFICNFDDDCSIISFWIINGSTYFWQNPLPDGHSFSFPSTLHLDTENHDLNMTMYQCRACNYWSSVITLVILDRCSVDVVTSTRTELDITMLPTILRSSERTPTQTKPYTETVKTFNTSIGNFTPNATQKTSSTISHSKTSSTLFYPVSATPLCEIHNILCDVTFEQDNSLSFGIIVAASISGGMILAGTAITLTLIIKKLHLRYLNNKASEPGPNVYEEVQLPETSEPVYSVIHPVSTAHPDGMNMNSNDCYNVTKRTQFEINSCPAYEL